MPRSISLGDVCVGQSSDVAESHALALRSRSLAIGALGPLGAVAGVKLRTSRQHCKTIAHTQRPCDRLVAGWWQVENTPGHSKYPTPLRQAGGRLAASRHAAQRRTISSVMANRSLASSQLQLAPRTTTRTGATSRPRRRWTPAAPTQRV